MNPEPRAEEPIETDQNTPEPCREDSGGAFSAPPGEVFQISQSPNWYAMRFHPETRKWVRLSTLTSERAVAYWRAQEWLREADKIRGLSPSCRPIPNRIPRDVVFPPAVWPPAFDGPRRSELPPLRIVEPEIREHRFGGRPFVGWKYWARRFDTERGLWRWQETNTNVTAQAQRIATRWVNEGRRILEERRRLEERKFAPPQPLYTVEGLAAYCGHGRLSKGAFERWRDTGQLFDPIDDGIDVDGRRRPARWCGAQLDQWFQWRQPCAIEFRRLWRVRFKDAAREQLLDAMDEARRRKEAST
ncbi:MAG TPA: hypothetical protein PKC43_06605 [Phycisphaerales bacterium]|nr:hypothetical protein [Phycisphaerales bacterium]HMP37102.1 hypothetical protein [Phycisphaerales bacterium]